jgi:hypothetical protein
MSRTPEAAPGRDAGADALVEIAAFIAECERRIDGAARRAGNGTLPPIPFCYDGDSGRLEYTCPDWAREVDLLLRARFGHAGAQRKLQWLLWRLVLRAQSGVGTAADDRSPGAANRAVPPSL